MERNLLSLMILEARKSKIRQLNLERDSCCFITWQKIEEEREAYEHEKKEAKVPS
jgi:hypothetical protein